MNSETHHVFSSDHPILSSNEDVLERKDFSEAIAKSIQGWNGNESLVIGLHGPWGCGKSSIKNMILEYLKTQSDKSPNIVNFNPWQWSGQDQLIQAFFQEIESALGGDNSAKGENTENRKKTWNQIGAYLTCGKNVMQALKMASPFLGLAPFSPILHAFEKIAEKSASAIKDGVDAQPDRIPHTLESLKNDLVNSMRSDPKQKNILVVIDDIDRMNVLEIRLLMQLIKINADFPKFIYLLLFQRDVVEKSLELGFEKVAPSSGRDYLQKIIQVEFSIPSIEPTKLAEFFIQEIAKIFGELKEEDKRRLTSLYFYDSLREFFKSIRSLKKYINTLAFHFSLLNISGKLEVDAVDLIVTEALRVFEPEVHQVLFDFKDILTGTSVDLERIEKSKEIFEGKILSKASSNRQHDVLKLLKKLFPKIEDHYKNDIEHFYSESTDSKLRICDPDNFDRYFLFRLNKKDLSQSEIQSILSVLPNKKQFLQELERLQDKKTLLSFFTRLDISQISEQQYPFFLASLFDLYDNLPVQAPGFVSNTEDHTRFIVFDTLKNPKDISKSSSIFLKSLEYTSGILMPLIVLSVEIKEQKTNVRSTSFFLNEGAFQKARTWCSQKIQDLIEQNKLQEHSRLPHVLYRWSEIENIDAPKKWLENHIQTDTGVFQILSQFVSLKSTSESYFDIQSLRGLIDIQVFQNKLDSIPDDRFSEKNKADRSLFKKAISGGEHDDS